MRGWCAGDVANPTIPPDAQIQEGMAAAEGKYAEAMAGYEAARATLQEFEALMDAKMEAMNAAARPLDLAKKACKEEVRARE